MQSQLMNSGSRARCRVPRASFTSHRTSLLQFYTDEWSTLKKIRPLLVAVVFCCFTKTSERNVSDTLKRKVTDTWRKCYCLDSRSKIASHNFGLNSRACDFVLRYNFLTNIQPSSNYPMIVFTAFPEHRLSQPFANISSLFLRH